MDLQHVGDSCHSSVVAQQDARYMLLKEQIVQVSEMGLKGLAIDGTLTQEAQDHLRSQGYDVLTPDAKKPSPLGYHLIVLW